MELRIVKRSGVDVVKSLSMKDEQSTVLELKQTIQQHNPKFTRHRQRLTFGPNNVLLDEGRTLKFYGIRSGDKITLKDLGPQMSWRTVFFVEYFGPIFFHALFFWLYCRFSMRSNNAAFEIQKTACAMIIAHYVKREFESAFVHRFSNSTMPLFNLFKNCAHYWIVGGIAMSFELYRPSFRAPFYLNSYLQVLCIAIFAFAEISNFWCHWHLRTLRPAGSKDRQIPRGYAFQWISSPNYFFESLAWLSVAVLLNTYTGWIFWIVSTVQMYLWAQKKHSNYRRQFKDYPRNRKAMFPGVC